MNIALLGLDSDTLAIAAIAGGDGRHRVAVVSDLPPDGIARLEAAGIHGVQAVPWESLMVRGTCDAVVVARAADDDAEELRTEQLRKLVQEGVPLLVAHPMLSTVLGCYEIDMIRREIGGVILPYLPARFSPTIEHIGRRLQDPQQSPIGEIEQIVFERTAKDRSRRAVLGHFARDVDSIRALAGDIVRVGALGSSNPQAAYANLTVQMSGEGPAVIRWSILPPSDNSAVRPEQRGADAPSAWLKIVGKKDRLELQPPDDRGSLLPTADLVGQETGDEGGEETPQRPEDSDGGNRPWTAPAAALERLARAIESPEAAAECTAIWSEAIRDVELADAIPRSLVRGRTIEVQHEQPTEEGTFKGLMTSLGCGLLLIGLGAVVVLALLDAVANANHWQALSAILRPWPWVLCGVFSVFLVFQLLLRITTRAEQARSGGTESIAAGRAKPQAEDDAGRRMSQW